MREHEPISSEKGQGFEVVSRIIEEHKQKFPGLPIMQTNIARESRLTRERVRQILIRLKDYGVEVPKLKIHWKLDDVDPDILDSNIEKLKQEGLPTSDIAKRLSVKQRIIEGRIRKKREKSEEERNALKQKLKKLKEEGKTFKQISVETNLPFNAVKGRLDFMRGKGEVAGRWKRRVRSKEEREEKIKKITQMREEKMSYEEIAKELSDSPSWVASVVRKHGLQRREKDVRARDLTIKALRHERKSVKQISILTGISEYNVSYSIRRLIKQGELLPINTGRTKKV